MHIYLLGYRGSGKTTVAGLLAQILDRPMVDTDDWVESAAGKSIREIFADGGEQVFRDREQQAIEQIANLPEPAIVALGGGAVLRPANQEVLKKTGHRVWLTASPQRLYDRITNDCSSADRRPSLTGKAGFDEVVNLLSERQPIYQQISEFTVDTDGLTPDQIAERILFWLKGSHR
jgi:shikimate kinase